MPTLTDKNQVFALQLSSANPITWTLQQQQTVATPQQVGSSTNPQNLDFEGIVSVAGNTAIGAPGIPGFTLEATYISLINTDPSVTQTVSYGKTILPHTYFQVSPTFVLAPGESAVFVKDAGWASYDANGVPKVGSAVSGVVFSDGSSQSTSAAPSNINACLVAASGAQSIGGTSNLQASFDTVIDQNTSPANNGKPFYNPSNPTYLTIPEPGYYLVNGGYSITPSGGPGQTGIQIFKKGYPGGDVVVFAQQTQEQNQTADNQSLNASAVIACVAGDQIYFNIENSGPDTLSVFGGNLCYLSVALLAGGG